MVSCRGDGMWNSVGRMRNWLYIPLEGYWMHLRSISQYLSLDLRCFGIVEGYKQIIISR